MDDGTLTTGTGGGTQLRLFTALHVPSEVARSLADRAESVALHATGLRATPPQELHVTWAFLGDVAEEYVPAVAGALDASAFRVPGPIACSIGEPGLMGRGRAVTLDVTLDLHAVLDSARDGFLDAVQAYAPGADHRPWHPHVTLLRARSEASAVRALDAVREARMGGQWIAPELRLYASLPGPTARIHKLLHSVPFGAPVARG